jgi:hypothetical protein
MWRFVLIVILSSPENRNSWIQQEGSNGSRRSMVKKLGKKIDTFDGAKPRFLNRGKKRGSVSTLSIPRASGRGVEWVDFAFLKILGYLSV